MASLEDRAKEERSRFQALMNSLLGSIITARIDCKLEARWFLPFVGRPACGFCIPCKLSSEVGLPMLNPKNCEDNILRTPGRYVSSIHDLESQLLNQAMTKASTGACPSAGLMYFAYP